MWGSFLLTNNIQPWARICERLRSPRIGSKESIPPGWESIAGLHKMFTNTGSGYSQKTEQNKEASSGKSSSLILFSNAPFWSFFTQAHHVMRNMLYKFAFEIYALFTHILCRLSSKMGSNLQPIVN